MPTVENTEKKQEEMKNLPYSHYPVCLFFCISCVTYRSGGCSKIVNTRNSPHDPLGQRFLNLH